MVRQVILAQRQVLQRLDHLPWFYAHNPVNQVEAHYQVPCLTGLPTQVFSQVIDLKGEVYPRQRGPATPNNLQHCLSLSHSTDFPNSPEPPKKPFHADLLPMHG